MGRPRSRCREGRLRRPGLLVAATALLVAAVMHFWLAGRPLSASIGEAATTFLLLAAAVVGVGLGLGCEAHRRKQRHS